MADAHARTTKLTCQMCGKSFRPSDVVPGTMLQHALSEKIAAEHPEWSEQGFICLDDLNAYRRKYIEANGHDGRIEEVANLNDKPHRWEQTRHKADKKMEKTDVEYLEYMWPMRHFLITCGAMQGEANIIAVSFCMPVSKAPPMLACAIGRGMYSCGLIEQTREFVVNVPTQELKRHIYDSPARSPMLDGPAPHLQPIAQAA